MDQMREILNEVKILSDKTARIETHIEYQKQQNDRIEKVLDALEATKAKVESHEIKIKAFSWILGIVTSIFTAKIFGQF